jgi:hypothetical protein
VAKKHSLEFVFIDRGLSQIAAEFSGDNQDIGEMDVTLSVTKDEDQRLFVSKFLSD